MNAPPARTPVAASGTNALLPGSVEFFARHTPDARALCEAERCLSYAELDAAADRLAEALHARAGIGRGDHVAVCMRNCLEWFVSQAASAKLAALLVPVSHRLTAAEVHYVVSDSQARAFLFDAQDVDAMARVWTDQPSLPDVRPTAVRLAVSVAASERKDVCVFRVLVEHSPSVRRMSDAAPRSIVYTSGTTGRPRGVLGRRTDEHARSAGTRVQPVAAADPPRSLLGAPLVHAAGQASARATLAAGGTVFIMPRFDAEQALAMIDRERITSSFLVPTMLSRIVHLPDEVRARYDVSSIRVLSTGASPCPHALKQRVIAYFGPDCLYEAYGSTEVGLVTRMQPADHLRKPGSCGTLLPGVDVKLVDDAGREVEPGECGEILVKTPVMIERYLNEGAPAELRDGFFATGDIGRFDQDGYLYVIDRKKDMIIAGGVNIYPAEIEAALRSHDAVLDAAAFGVPEPERGEQVRAAIECVPGRQVSEAELLAFLEDKLAGFKRPRAIDVVAELPRNAAGKLLKAKLRAPFWAHARRVI